MNKSELLKLVKQKVENLRPKLLDLSRRNPLLATKLSPRSNAHVRVVDELPDVLFYRLNNGQQMRLIALPEIDNDPKDEDTKQFRDALTNARITDEAYLTELEAIERDADDYLDRTRTVERSLKDRLRAELGLPPRPRQADINLAQHARNNGITPSYELPEPGSEAENGRHTDNDIQTLLLPKDLERKLNNVTSKCRTWIQETGINVLHVAYGFLEWSEPNQTETSFAPLILSSAQIEKRRTREGVEFHVAGSGEDPEVNAVLAEKMRIEFGIELPQFEGASVENYLRAIAAIEPKQITWRVRRQVAIGVFPSARMAMYHDIDPAQPTFPDNDVVRSLLAGSNNETAAPFAEEYNVDEPEIERSVPCVVLDADSSQFSTLVDIANGRNLAVEGPPGTGKSQTIVNAIAAALAAGKKVLFVAEKLAALNVVRSRLEAIGLGEFLLPLQAERSTREQVIASVRARVEMRKPAAIRDYDDKVADYKRVRALLSEYIKLLTLEFEDSGLTVHNILSKSIATSSYLAGLPAEILEKSDISAEYLNRAGIAQLRALAESVEKAAANAMQAKPYWSSAGLLHPERFSVEEACNLALQTSNAYSELAVAQSILPMHKIDVRADDDALAALRQSLERLLALPGSLSTELLIGLLNEQSVTQILKFIRACAMYREEEQNLLSVMATEISEDTLAAVEKVEVLCFGRSFETLDLVVLETKLKDLREKVERAQGIVFSMAPLVQAHPDAAEWKLEGIHAAHKAISEAGRDVLLRRKAIMSDPAAVSLLGKLCVDGRSLQTTRAVLERKVSLSLEVSLETITHTIDTLRAAGVFSFLSGQCRRAKGLARSLSLLGRYDRREALERLEALAVYRRKERAFLENPQVANLFGLEFRGVETDFAPFEKLKRYYDSTQTRLAGHEMRQVRLFLHSAEVDELELIPAIPMAGPGEYLHALQGELVALEQQVKDTTEVLNALRPLLGIFRDSSSIKPNTLHNFASHLRAFLEKRQALDGDKAAAALLGERFQGSRTSTEAIRQACNWARDSLPVGVQVAAVLMEGSPDKAVANIRQVTDASGKTRRLLSELCALVRLKPEHFTNGRDSNEIAALLELAAADQDGLFSHAALATELKELKGTGTDCFVSHRMQAGALIELARQFEALAVRKLAKSVFTRYGKKLSRFPGSRLDELRTALATQDKEIIKLACQQLRWKVHASAKPPYGNGVGKKSSWTQMALIDNEISKQQRFISVRDLTQRAGRALLELKPCWMMSPLAVAQYIPKNIMTFDLCIIDEASQMPPEASIGALLRCKQAVVVGDTNQLPPSSFFKKMIDDEEADEDETVLNESILEMANATFRPARRLRWHYRSRHSGLIKFSNRLVYEDDLIVFPSANESIARMGVELRAVGGLYKAGTNPVEARSIVDAALEFMRTDPDRSLGIVTLNQKQRDLIAEEFEYALSRSRHALTYIESWKERNDGLEEFFIKNLENVQGDERDVMFIGTVYGPDAKGARVAQRFGPINGLAGRRRLNVLFSRAKEKIVTFSSMTAADILAEETGNAGAYMLKRWLEYCGTGVLDGGVESKREPDSDFEIFVMDQIRAMGYEPVPQVGVAGYYVDIGVRHSDWRHGYVLGVECDGASYHSAKSARDRDRLRQEVLERLGWRFHRIWSTDWFNNPRREAERLRGVLSARIEELFARESEFTYHPRRDESAPTGHPPVSETEVVGPLFDAVDQAMPFSPLAKSVSIHGVAVGDTVRVRYLDGDCKVMQLIISATKSDLGSGIVHSEAPIAKALLGAEEGDEVEVLNGPYVRPAVIESISKGNA